LQNEESENHEDGDNQPIRMFGETVKFPLRRGKARRYIRYDDSRRRGSAAVGKPVAPADDESGVVAERTPREIVLAAAAGIAAPNSAMEDAPENA